MNREKIFYWLPRYMAIFYILFLAIFALDVFIPGETIGYYLVALFIHLVPNLILTAILFIAWKYEKAGSLLFTISFFILLAVFREKSFLWMQFLLFSPLLVVSILFLFHSVYKRR